MAMTACTECKTQISTKALACPRCGARRRKPTSLFTWVFGGLFTIAVASGVISAANSPSARAGSSDAKPAAASVAADAADMKRYQAATSVAAYLKSRAREPDSLQFESMGVSDDATVVCSSYRARNGFGGMNREAMIFIGDEGQAATAAAWKRRCTNLRDFMYAVK
jgi:hypothetical protein